MLLVITMLRRGALAACCADVRARLGQMHPLRLAGAGCAASGGMTNSQACDSLKIRLFGPDSNRPATTAQWQQASGFLLLTGGQPAGQDRGRQSVDNLTGLLVNPGAAQLGQFGRLNLTHHVAVRPERDDPPLAAIDDEDQP